MLLLTRQATQSGWIHQNIPKIQTVQGLKKGGGIKKNVLSLFPSGIFDILELHVYIFLQITEKKLALFIAQWPRSNFLQTTWVFSYQEIVFYKMPASESKSETSFISGHLADFATDLTMNGIFNVAIWLFCKKQWFI